MSVDFIVSHKAKLFNFHIMYVTICYTYCSGTQ